MPREFKAMIFYPDDREVEQRTLTASNGRVPSFDELREFVTPIIGTSWMEHVSVLYQNKQADMFVDENGRMLGLPINKRATEIYLEASRQRKFPIDPDAFIVGTAILFAERVWF